MKRILLMVVRNIVRIPYAWIKLCYLAAHVDQYPERELYEYLRWMDFHANRGGNVKIEVCGLENVPEKDGLIFFPNHQGLYDVLAVIEAFPRPFSVVAKKEIGGYSFPETGIRLYEGLHAGPGGCAAGHAGDPGGVPAGEGRAQLSDFCGGNPLQEREPDRRLQGRKL